MQPSFQRSERTRKLIDVFTRMSIDETISRQKISRTVGFDVTPGNSYSARNIVEKEHRIFIYIDRDRGFVRGDGHAMTATGAGFLRSMRRKGVKCGRRMELALSQNLTRDDHYVASETMKRAGIAASVVSSVRVLSNRATFDPGAEAGPFDTSSALRRMK